MRQHFTKSMVVCLAVWPNGCESEDHSMLARRELGVVSASGWARVKIPPEVSQQRDSLWLSDENGTPVPFVEEREGLWRPQRLGVIDLLLGIDDQGRPTAEFGLKSPEGWKIRDREHLELALSVIATGPWVARVDVAQQRHDGVFVTSQASAPMFVYELGNQARDLDVVLPWDADRYRVTLSPTQGPVPKITAIAVTASTVPEALEPDARIGPITLRTLATTNDRGRQGYELELPGPDRVVAFDLTLRAPVAPVVAGVRRPSHDPQRRPVELGSGLLWNLPALQHQSERITIAPTFGQHFELSLPEGVVLTAAHALVHREALLFPAEAEARYYIHTGGRVVTAPGDLATLPVSRLVYERSPVTLGDPEPDPHGRPHVLDAGQRTRPWLPYVIGVLVVVLGVVAFSLLRASARLSSSSRD